MDAGQLVYRNVAIYLVLDDAESPRYIGKSVAPIQRCQKHLRRQSWAASYRILEWCPEGAWESREKYWIAYYRRRYPRWMENISKGGSGTTAPVRLGHKSSAESNRKRSESLERTLSSPEHRQRMSEIASRMWEDPNYRNKVIPAMAATMQSPEVKAKLSRSRKQMWQSMPKEQREMRIQKTSAWWSDANKAAQRTEKFTKTVNENHANPDWLRAHPNAPVRGSKRSSESVRKSSLGNRSLDDETENVVIALYTEQYLSAACIAVKLGIAKRTVQSVLTRHRVPRPLRVITIIGYTTTAGGDNRNAGD